VEVLLIGLVHVLMVIPTGHYAIVPLANVKFGIQGQDVMLKDRVRKINRVNAIFARLTLLILLLLAVLFVSQAQDTQFKLNIDSLGIHGITDTIYPNFKFDSVQIELFVNKVRVAILSSFHEKYINKVIFNITTLDKDVLDDGRIILRVCYHMDLIKFKEDD
jgi:hypothetical protein